VCRDVGCRPIDRPDGERVTFVELVHEEAR
jgi:hypothetical protein